MINISSILVIEAFEFRICFVFRASACDELSRVDFEFAGQAET